MKLRSLALTAISLLICFANFTFFRLVLDIKIEPDNTLFWLFLLFSLLLVQFLLWIFEIENIINYLLWICIIFAFIALILPIFTVIGKLILKVLVFLFLLLTNFLHILFYMVFHLRKNILTNL